MKHMLKIFQLFIVAAVVCSIRKLSRQGYADLLAYWKYSPRRDSKLECDYHRVLPLCR